MGEDVCFVIGKVLEEFALMQAKYKLLINHSPLLGNDDSSNLVPDYDPGHTLGTGEQEPHSYYSEKASNLFNRGEALHVIYGFYFVRICFDATVRDNVAQKQEFIFHKLALVGLGLA
ncbi:hypothetical protein DSO57_1033396 [Entomophthora muscae]|uniref:Uncharacterized protein n=1 Tax=Entomophthora muscae TaxID=34485 RepID=A0ACC2REX5_9FUNG|nr:hypothetical protein DSO57_1033396 [Entomophthora muscae]